ncbi:transcriptional regulator, DeoR family [Natronoarchaeum philippinense]|uniref:Transcriptional regulator, DeoR family n=1 Tax=Natronoarchaeum philippinense TaxID=558529 RepID=A0A285NSN0_NATPI|nr:HTH-type transcriptional regulator GlpR [Natronoarchaeum philippinense]SNZ12502.1 transcriptional regulator, DeoR family [Natronoarchaeum philippinense]
MLPEARQRKIVELVSDRDGCSVEELADEMDCSKATIRRDLNELADKQLIERSHGGAVPATSVGQEQTYRQKEVQNLEGKVAIAERAVEEVHDNQVVFFDAGSTTMQVAKQLPANDSVLAVTNSPLQAMELDDDGTEVKLTGGSLRRPTRALVGPSAERFMERTTFDVLFLGTNAIDADGGLMTPNEDEARVKELMIENSHRVVLVADGSKFGEQSFIRFAALDDIDVFVTDTAVPPDLEEQFESSDVTVVEVQ